VAAAVTVEIVNKKGLHARAAAKFVKIVAKYDAEVKVTKLGSVEESGPVCGSSILGLMMFGADPGSKLLIEAQGVQADEVVAALRELVANRFGEWE
jgi:phosphocarrier protein HPr